MAGGGPKKKRSYSVWRLPKPETADLHVFVFAERVGHGTEHPDDEFRLGQLVAGRMMHHVDHGIGFRKGADARLGAANATYRLFGLSIHHCEESCFE